MLDKLLEHRACAAKADVDDQDVSEVKDVQDDARAVVEDKDEGLKTTRTVAT